MPLHIVPPAPKPDKRPSKLAKAPKPDDMIECPRCQGREVTPTIIGAMLVKGKLKGGTTQYICTCCALRGERVAIG